MRATLPALGLAHFSAIQVPPAELVGLASKAGFSAVGLRLHPAFPGAPTYELPAGSAAAREVLSRLDGEGVRVHDVEFVVLSPDFVPAAMTPVLEAASALGAKRLSVCGDDGDRGRLTVNFAALCDLAAPFGIAIDLENMGWRTVASFADAAALVEAAGRENAGMLVDALHFSRNGAVPGDLRGVPTARIRSVQLCDAGAEAPSAHDEMIREARSRRLAPGQGTLPLVELVRAVPEGAALSVEVPIDGATPPQVHVARLYETARRVLQAAELT